MRKLIAWAFMYSLDGFLADDGTDYWRYCFGLPRDPAETAQKVDVYQGAYAHIMGRVAYQAMADALPADHPFTPILNPARKVVFSRTLATADWANTTIAAGDTTEEIDKIRRGGDGHIVVWGGVRLWRSLMRLDLIDEFRLDLHPYVAGEGTGCSTRMRRGITGSTWFPAPSSATGSSGCTIAGTAEGYIHNRSVFPQQIKGRDRDEFHRGSGLHHPGWRRPGAGWPRRGPGGRVRVWRMAGLVRRRERRAGVGEQDGGAASRPQDL